MKFIAKSLTYFSCLLLGFLEAKTLTFEFDHITQLDYQLNATIADGGNHFSLINHPHTRRLVIENKGTKELRNFVPHINDKKYLTLVGLAEKIAKDPNPILSLYHNYRKLLPISNHYREYDYSPLEFINFVGCVTEQEFQTNFIKLCHLLGIDTRNANVKGRAGFDLCWNEENWSLIELTTGQSFLGWDNQKLLSSEELRDDPLLILRSKFGRTSPVDFVRSWEEFARFDVFGANISEKDERDDLEYDIPAIHGFDLFAGEKLAYLTPENESERPHQIRVEQVIDLSKRGSSVVPAVYHSPYPIREILNDTHSMIYVKNLDLYVRPKSHCALIEKKVFKLEIQTSGEVEGDCVIISSAAWSQFPSLQNGINHIHLGTSENSTSLYFEFDVNEQREFECAAEVQVLNHESEFGYDSPLFMIGQQSAVRAEKIWWQIDSSDLFKTVPSNLDMIEEYKEEVRLPIISETFLNPNQTYYFRVRGFANGSWSEWSIPFAFSVKKPLRVELVEFEKISNGTYLISWEREAEVADDPIEYLVYGSNTIDFIPSLYCQFQPDEIVNGQPVIVSTAQNLVKTTFEPMIEVDGSLAYYRVIARQNGQYSVPSPIIHVYDSGLVHPRNVLELYEVDGQNVNAKRVLLPPSYGWTDVAYPLMNQRNRLYENSLLHIASMLKPIGEINIPIIEGQYVRPNAVSREIWEQVKPWFLPENHPSKAKIDRIFSNSRVTLTQETMNRAGFHGRTGRYTRVTAVAHGDCPDCFFKVFCDCETHLRMPEWQKWLQRIHGKNLVKECIRKYRFDNHFATPHKWIYPLPEHPACPKSSRYLPKNFILVCSNARLYDHETNKKYWKEKMTPRVMEELYVLLDECGMWDSVFPFNIPYCKTGKFTWCDTEYYHKWPVNFAKLTKYFKKDNQRYWEYLIKHNGPKWYTRGGEDGRKKN